jgi:hypothetical protein
VLQDVGGQGFEQPFAMNGTEQSVGYSAIPGGYEAVLWSSSGAATVLKNIGGQSFSIALAINASGDSVGYSDTASGSEAVLWSPDGKATNLGAALGSLWSDTEAVGINKTGDIIGFGDYEGKVQGFLLVDPATPAPELSTWAMLVAGFIGLGFAGRRRAAKHRVVIETAWRSSRQRAVGGRQSAVGGESLRTA